MPCGTKWDGGGKEIVVIELTAEKTFEEELDGGTKKVYYNMCHRPSFCYVPHLANLYIEFVSPTNSFTLNFSQNLDQEYPSPFKDVVVPGNANNGAVFTSGPQEVRRSGVFHYTVQIDNKNSNLPPYCDCFCPTIIVGDLNIKKKGKIRDEGGPEGGRRPHEGQRPDGGRRPDAGQPRDTGHGKK